MKTQSETSPQKQPGHVEAQAPDTKKKKATQEKAPSFFSELGGFMKPYRGGYALSIFISVLSVVAYLGSYAFAGAIVVALLTPGQDIATVILCVAGCVLCKLLYAVLLNVSTWISHKAAYHTLRDIRHAVTETMTKLPLGYFEQTGSGRLKTLVVDHIESMEKTLAHMLPEMTANLIAPACMLIWMFFIDWRLALVALIWVILGFSVTGGMMKGYEEKFAGQVAANKAMNQAVVEFIRGIEVIKNFGRADECYKKYTDAVYGHADYNVGWQKDTQKWSALGMAIAPYSLFAVLIAGAIFYAQGTLEPATLFMMLILTMGVFGPLMRAMMYFDQVAQMGVNAQEIHNVLEHPCVSRGSQDIVPHANISFENVTFTYDENLDPALKGISFKTAEGTMTALVGPSGSGKSTIAKLLAGYWDPTSGVVKVGDQPLSAYTQDALNNTIAYVDQDTFLFNVSIMDNIRMGNPSATDEEVIDAAVRSGCDEFIRALPDGYQTLAGAAGSQLSGGERQRICIARAVMKNAPILILDEATASSDPENEAAIQDALAVAMKGRTLIVVAHRLSTIVGAEQILYIDKGEVTAAGTHTELCESCPDYASMWNISQGGAR